MTHLTGWGLDGPHPFRIGLTHTANERKENTPWTSKKPQDYVDALKRLEGFPLMGMEIKDGRKVVTIELAQPTDPLPVYVAALKEALVGSRVQSVSATDGGLCLHLDDDYDAVTNGALRVRIHPERVPFTVGDVFVNRGGADLVLCVCAQASEEDKNANKPVVAFKIDRDILDRKELSFNVI